MTKLNIHDAKTHLSSILAKLPKGASFLICRRNEPIAEVRKLGPGEGVKRRIGLDKGSFKVSKSFFDTLPAEFLKSFKD